MLRAIHAVLPILAVVGGSVALVSRTAAPVPGPGGVIDTMQDFITALDTGSARSLGAILDVQKSPGFVVQPDASSKWGFKEVKRAYSPRFVDVTWDDQAFSVQDRKQFIHKVHSGITRSKQKASGMQTKIISLRAECPSADVSYAVIEFERSYTIEGKSRGSKRMIGTALLRHVRKAKDGDPDFRIFQWHASVVTPKEPVAKKND